VRSSHIAYHHIELWSLNPLYPDSDDVVCYVMTRSDFSRVLGNMRDILDGKVATRKSRISSFKQIRVNYDLNELKMLNVLGYVEVLLADPLSTLDEETSHLSDELHANLFRSYSQGAFGKVRLVKAADSGECYALKAQGKHFIVENKQERYVLNELRLVRARLGIFVGNPKLIVLSFTRNL